MEDEEKKCPKCGAPLRSQVQICITADGRSVGKAVIADCENCGCCAKDMSAIREHKKATANNNNPSLQTKWKLNEEQQERVQLNKLARRKEEQEQRKDEQIRQLQQELAQAQKNRAYAESRLKKRPYMPMRLIVTDIIATAIYACMAIFCAWWWALALLLPYLILLFYSIGVESLAKDTVQKKYDDYCDEVKKAQVALGQAQASKEP